MKVLHLSFADDGAGAFKAAYRIHRGLLARGVESSMVVSRRTTNDSTVYGPRTSIGRLTARLTIELDNLPWRVLRQSPRGWCSLACVGTKLVPRVRAMTPDIVQLHWICAGMVRLESLARLHYPLVWRLADMWPIAGTQHYVGDDLRYRNGYRAATRPMGERGIDLERWVWERKRRVYARLPDLTIVTPSQWLARCARESVLFRDRRIEVIPTGQNIETFKPLAKPFARDALGLPAGVKLIMTGSGDLGDPRKGLGHLLRALETLRGRDYELLLIGEAPRTLPPLPIRAHWLGRLNDDVSLALAYSASDVFVAPSTQENLANTVIEAMACGVPCVAFRIGGMPDIIRPDRNGYLAEPFDAESLAQGIVSLLESGEAGARLRHEARLTVEREFSSSLQAQRYETLYAELVEASRRTGTTSIARNSA